MSYFRSQDPHTCRQLRFDGCFPHEMCEHAGEVCCYDRNMVWLGLLGGRSLMNLKEVCFTGVCGRSTRGLGDKGIRAVIEHNLHGVYISCCKVPGVLSCTGKPVLRCISLCQCVCKHACQLVCIMNIIKRTSSEQVYNGHLQTLAQQAATHNQISKNKYRHSTCQQ